MPKGVLNPEYELCRALAQEIGNDSHQSIMRFKRELKELRTWKDHEKIVRIGFNGSEVVGYTVDEIIDCWRWIRTREEFPIKEARLTTTLLGSPSNLQKYDAWIIENIPPIWDSSSFDSYVRQHAKILARLGFVYRGGRIGAEELEQLGLKGRQQ